MYYYFITVDKATGIQNPSKQEYYDILEQIYAKFSMRDISPNKVECFEYKEKGNRRKKTKIFDWLHFHGIATSGTLLSASQLKFYKKGYKTVILHLETIDDVARTSGYIQKHMLNECDVGRNHCLQSKREPMSAMANVFDEYAFEDSSSNQQSDTMSLD